MGILHQHPRRRRAPPSPPSSWPRAGPTATAPRRSRCPHRHPWTARLVYGLTHAGEQSWLDPPTLALRPCCQPLRWPVLRRRTQRRLAAGPAARPEDAHRRAGATFSALLAFVTETSLVFLLTLYLQQILGYSPLAPVLAFAVLGLGTVLGGIVGPKVIGAVGNKRPSSVASSSRPIATASLVVLQRPCRHHACSWSRRSLGASRTWSSSSGFMVTVPPACPRPGTGLATGLATMSQQIGITMGIPIMSAIVTATVHTTGATSSTSVLHRPHRGDRRQRGPVPPHRVARAHVPAHAGQWNNRQVRVRAPDSPAAAGSTPPPRSASATSVAGSSCSTSGRSAASTACTCWTSCARSRRSTPRSWSSSASTRRSSCTRPIRTRSWRRSSATASPPGARRPRAHRPGRPTPPGPGRRSCWSTRRATSSRTTPARGTRTRSPRCSRSWSRSTGPRDAAARRLAVRPAGHRAHRPALPGEGGPVARRPGAGRRRRPRPVVLLTADGEVERRSTASASPTGCASSRPAGSRLRRRRRRHGRPPAGRLSLRHRCGARPWPATASSGSHGDGTSRSAARGTSPGGRDRVWIAMAGVHQLWTYDPPPARRGRRRHGQRGAARRPVGRGLVRPDERTRGRRRPAVDRRLRDSSLRYVGTVRSTPPSAPASSTSASATARPPMRSCSIRSASPCSPTDRSPSPTPTTAPSAASSRAR